MKSATHTTNGQSDAVHVNGCAVPLCRPYEPPAMPMVGLDGALQELLAAWLCLKGERPLGALLVGPPGVGKNQLVYEAARRTGKPLYMRLGGESLRDDDFAIDFNAKLETMLSPLATAMVTGGIFFVDEIGEVRETAQSKLLSVLDDRSAIEVPMLGWIRAHPGFRFVAAMNTSDQLYHPLPEKIRQRMWTINISPPSGEVIRQILMARFPDFRNDLEELLLCFWRLWKETRGDRPPTPRDVIHLFSQAMKHAALEEHLAGCSGSEPLSLSIRSQVSLAPHHLECVFASMPPENSNVHHE